MTKRIGCNTDTARQKQQVQGVNHPLTDERSNQKLWRPDELFDPSSEVEQRFGEICEWGVTVNLQQVEKEDLKRHQELEKYFPGDRRVERLFPGRKQPQRSKSTGDQPKDTREFLTRTLSPNQSTENVDIYDHETRSHSCWSGIFTVFRELRRRDTNVENHQSNPLSPSH